MSWKERAEAYASIGSAAGQRNDDFVARKVLKGVGWSERKLPLLCSKLDVPWDGSAPLWDTTRDCLDVMSGNLFGHNSPNRKFILDVRPLNKKGMCWKDQEELDEYCEIAQTVSGGFIVCGRKQISEGVSEAIALCFLNEAYQPPVWILQPPAALRERRNTVAVWVRRVEDLFRDMSQFMGWNVPQT
jgi:hypothetical protein